VVAALQAQNARRRLSQGELDLMVSAHERFIEGRPGGKRASLRFVDLSGLDLTDRNLSDADLSGSVFDNCKMARAKLERASLFGCDLKRADLREAILRRADLRGACLRGANVALADLTGADFREGQIGVAHPTKGLDLLRSEARAGQLDQVNFAGAKLDGSKMEQVSACASDFTDCSMKGAILSGANLKDANLSGANLEGADIGGAILENANFLGAVLTGVDVGRARSSTGANLAGCLGAPTEAAVARTLELLERAKSNQMWCDTGAKHGSPAIMDGEDLRPLGLRLRGFRLTVMSAKGACLVGLDLTGCQLQGANFEGADLRSVCFKNADLRGARMAGANLTRADFTDAVLAPLPLGAGRENPVNLRAARLRYAVGHGADLTNAVLDDADLRGADFTGANIEGVSLNGANLMQANGLASRHAKSLLHGDGGGTPARSA